MPDLPLMPSRPRVPVTPAQTPGTSGLMTLATGVVVVAALYVAREVLIPVTLAVLLSFLLAPLVDLLRRARLPRVPAVLLAVVLALGVILAVGGVIGAQVAGLAGDIPHYASTIEDKVQSFQGATVGKFSGLIERLARQAEHATHAPAGTDGTGKAAADGQPAAVSPTPKPMPVEIHEPPSSPTEIAERILTPALSPLATTGIVFVVAIFILLQQSDLRDRLIRLFGAHDLLRTMTAMDDAARRLSRYFLSLLGLNVAFGCVVGGGLLLIGVPKPVLWGIVAALMRFVPYIGAFLSASLPLALAAAVDPGWSMLVWTAALFLVGELLMGQIVEPLVYGNSTGLSPLSVVISAIFWGWLWGPIGLILSMPLTLCLVVLARHVDRLQFLDVLLGDQPALTPVESFYHRMLAGNLDDVLDYAEQFLKQDSLSAYYDEVAIGGLRLAAVDAERGVLTEDQIEQVMDGVEDLIDDLSDRDDRDPIPGEAEDDDGGNPAGPAREVLHAPHRPTPDTPPPETVAAEWHAPSAVLCVAGRGPLDHATAAMLAQLLGKHGLGARAAAHEVAGSRSVLTSLDFTGVMMVCLCYAGIGGTPSHLRYAVRRLRERLPNAMILVGLWPEEMARDQRLREAVGADLYAASLRDAIAACLEAAQAGPEDAAARRSDDVLLPHGPVLDQSRPA